MAQPQHCPHCQHAVTPENLYCPDCGRELGEPPKSSLLHRFKKDLNDQHQKRMESYGLSSRQEPAAEPEPIFTGKFQDVEALHLTAEIKTLPVCYSLFHIGAATTTLTLRNNHIRPSQNLMVSIRLSPNEYSDTWEENIPQLGAGETWTRNITLPLRPEPLKAVNEKQKGSLQVNVSDKSEKLVAITEPIDILAYNEWFFHPCLMPLLSVFVQPNHQALHNVIEKASKRLQQNTGDGSFEGYQRNDSERVMQMLEAIHQTLALDYKIGYINPPASFEKTGQKIRLVDDTLKQKRGTCLDLAVLQAALWERIGLHPLLVVIPGHAFLGCWLVDQTSTTSVIDLVNVPENAKEEALQIVQALENGDLLLFNSVEVCHGQPLERANENGMGYLHSILNPKEPTRKNPFLFLIDVAASRTHFTPLP